MSIDSTRPELVEHYIDLVGLEWRRRARLLGSSVASFEQLEELDDRLAAGIDALDWLGRAADAAFERLLKQPLQRGETFAVLCHGFAGGNPALLDAGCAVAMTMPHLHGALLAAMQWASVSPALLARAEALPASLRLALLCSRGAELQVAPESVFAWLRTLEPTPELVCCGLTYVRHVGDAERAQAAVHHLSHERAAVRLAAARTLLALAQPPHLAPAIVELEDLARAVPSKNEQGGPYEGSDDGVQATALECLLMQHGAVSDSTWSLIATAPRRLQLRALGWTGCTDIIPMLMEALAEPEHARIAAASLSLITGSQAATDGWQANASPAFFHAPRSDEALHAQVDNGGTTDPDYLLAADPDARLPWPDRAAFAAWWQANRTRFDNTTRHLGGQPLGAASLRAVVRNGPLGWRPFASGQLQSLLHCPLPALDLPAPEQRGRFPGFAEGPP